MFFKTHYKKIKSSPVQIVLIIITSMMFGFLVITQARYFTGYIASEGRDSSHNIFREIQILKTSNDELKEEIENLEVQIQDLSDQALALQSIENEILKNKIIAGKIDVFGPGIKLEISSNLNEIWFTDLYNELLVSGAEAVSVNNIRITDTTAGFDTIPNGQIMINGVVLSPPYTFSAIGEKEVLKQSLEAPYGILEKINSSMEGFSYTLVERDRIEMGKV